MIRPPAVAGRFYPDDPVRLAEQVDAFLATTDPQPATRARACLVPHAGYIYSGRVAGAVYQRLQISPRIVLIGPRHFPRGAPMAILTDGEWQTPLGLSSVDRELAAKIALSCSLLREDAFAHSSEYSLEVQLPFLQRMAPDFRFVPIVIGPARYPDLVAVGDAIADAVLAENEPILIVASSDLNHYESDEITRVKDRKAIDRILALDPAGLFETVHTENISMCGYAAVVAALCAARKLGASQAELVAYATSGELSGQTQEVVGYGGMLIS